MLSGDLTRTAGDRAGGGRGRPARGRLRALPAGPADARVDRGERRRRRRRASSARRSSGSSTASASRSTAAATTCASTRATSTTSPARCPGIVDAVRALPVQQAVLDGEAIWMTRRAARPPFQETVAQIDARRAARRESRRSSSTCCTSTATTCSTRRSSERAARLEAVAPQLKIPGVVDVATPTRRSACSTRRCAPATRASW